MHDAEDRPRLYLDLEAPQYREASEEKKPEAPRVIIIDLYGDEDEDDGAAAEPKVRDAAARVAAHERLAARRQGH